MQNWKHDMDSKTTCVVYLLYLVSAFSIVHGAINIEKYLKTCDRNSPEVNECLTEAIQEGLAVMSDGIKDLGVPPVDPYHQKELRVDYKNNQILVKMIMKDIFVEGLRSAKVHDVRLRADEENFYMEVDLTTPKVFVQGLYLGEGSYNSLHILASGGFNTTMTDLTYTWKLSGSPEKINNETFIKINSFYMRPDVGNLKSYLSNDNPDTQEFITLGNNFANANWRVLYRELLPYAQANWNKIGVKVANKIFLKIPYDRLFPAKS